MFLRRRSPSAFATPAWMAEILQTVPPEAVEKHRQLLFDVRRVPGCRLLTCCMPGSQAHACRCSGDG